MTKTKEIDSVPARDIEAPVIQDLVFLLVYGTLRKGQSRHGILEQPNVDYMDTIVLPNYSLLDLGPYPTVVHARNNVKGVVCEMYKLPLSVLMQIDNLEDCPEVFTRTMVPDTPNCFIYTMKMHEAYAHKTKKIDWIQDGDYIAHLTSKKHVPSIEGLEED